MSVFQHVVFILLLSIAVTLQVGLLVLHQIAKTLKAALPPVADKAPKGDL